MSRQKKRSKRSKNKSKKKKVQKKNQYDPVLDQLHRVNVVQEDADLQQDVEESMSTNNEIDLSDTEQQVEEKEEFIKHSKTNYKIDDFVDVDYYKYNVLGDEKVEYNDVVCITEGITKKEDNKYSKVAQWEDITDFLKNVGGNMKYGELINLPNFSLFSSMSALELMDDKLDPCHNISELITVDKALNIVKPENFTIKDIVGVMDALTSLEMSWIDGQSVSVTLFTWVYLHKIEQLKEKCPILYNYGRMFLKTSNAIHTTICEADIVMEDFNVAMYGFTFGDEKIEDVQKDYQNILDDIGKKIRKAKLQYRLDNYDKVDEKVEKVENKQEQVENKQEQVENKQEQVENKQVEEVEGAPKKEVKNKKPKKTKEEIKELLEALKDVTPIQDDVDKEVEYCTAILGRLKFRKNLYTLLTEISKPDLAGIKQAQKAHVQLKRNILNIQKTINAGTELTKTKTEEEKKPKESPLIYHDEEYQRLGFYDELNKGVIRSAPPRKFNKLSHLAALRRWNHYLYIVEKLFMLRRFDTFDDILAHYKILSGEGPNILARSNMFSILCSENNFLGKGSLEALLIKSFQKFCPLCIKYMKKDVDTKYFKNFVGRVCTIICQQFHIYSQERSRQYRSIGKILNDWAILQHESNILDQRAAEQCGGDGKNFDSVYFAWVLNQTLELLIHFITIGFELQLYNRREFGWVFWYYEHLFNLRNRNRQLAYQHVSLDPKANENEKERIPPRKLDYSLCEVESLMAHGTYRIEQLLVAIGMAKPSEQQYKLTTESIVFSHRFKIFSTVPQPTPRTLYEYYEDHVKDLSQLLEYCHKSFQASKSQLEEIVEHFPKEIIQQEHLKIQRLWAVSEENIKFVVSLQRVIQSNALRGASVLPLYVPGCAYLVYSIRTNLANLDALKRASA